VNRRGLFRSLRASSRASSARYASFNARGSLCGAGPGRGAWGSQVRFEKPAERGPAYDCLGRTRANTAMSASASATVDREVRIPYRRVVFSVWGSAWLKTRRANGEAK
jgi:hypothetical protein